MPKLPPKSIPEPSDTSNIPVAPLENDLAETQKVLPKPDQNLNVPTAETVLQPPLKLSNGLSPE